MPSPRWSGRRFCYRTRQLDCDKILGWVQIILAGFIDDSEVTVLGRSVVVNDLINLAQFQVFAAVVANAESKFMVPAAQACRVRICSHGIVTAEPSRVYPNAFSADPALNHPICCAVML